MNNLNVSINKPMAYTITETLDTLDKTGYLMIDINEINNLNKNKMENNYKPKQGELIWVLDVEGDEKSLRFFKEFDDDGDLNCYANTNDISDELELDTSIYWKFYERHEGIIHPHFRSQNTLLNFNQY